MWSLLLAAALAAEAPAADVAGKPGPDDEVSRALEAELKRSLDGLSLPGSPDIYHLRYHALLLRQVDARAALGAIVDHDADPFNALGIELRVGSPKYDNTGFGGWQNGFSIAWLPQRLTPEAVRIDAWRQTDRSFKQAVEQYARKQAQFEAPEDYPGDYLLTGGTTATLDLGKPPEAEPLLGRARALSGAMAGAKHFERGEVQVGAESGGHWIIDSEGTRVLVPVEECTIRAWAHLRTPDGLVVTDHRLWTVRHQDTLPPQDEMLRDVGAMMADMQRVVAAEPLDDEYVGPVIFEEAAAVDLFRWLLIPQLEGTPAEVPFDSWFGEIANTSGASVRVGRRVLPLGWTTVDDPRRDPAHPSSFAYDFEGTPAQSVTLVTDGIVRTLLMSRVPRKELVGSNGHARGGLGDRLAGRAAQMVVEPDAAVSQRKLLKKAMRLAASYGHDHVLVVRRLQEPAILGAGDGGGFSLFGGDDDSGSALPPPMAVWRVYADGREELLRGARFAGVHRWVLRDIVAAGPQVEGSFMQNARGGDTSNLGPTEGLPTWLSAPSVLIGEMELVPDQGDPRAVPVLPPPAAGGE